MITFAGRQDNVVVREAAIFAFGANLLMIIAAIISIILLVPKGRVRDEAPLSTRAQVGAATGPGQAP